MSARRSIRSSLVLGLALGGLLAGHALTYQLLMPDVHTRAAELAGTGHGYLDQANMIGVLAAVASLAALFLGRLLRSESASTSSILVRLAGVLLRAADRLAAIVARPPVWPPIAALGTARAENAPANPSLVGSPPGRAPPSVLLPA